MEIIELKNIVKVFDEDVVLNNINLKVKKNEFLTLLGPSGCGKTTILRIIGGFEDASEGKVFFEGKDIAGLPPYKRQINTVFQKYALFPHMNVYENIAFGLRIKGVGEKEIEERVNEMLALVNLRKFAKRNINSLSGGQQQRIAIARALVNRPKVLLLDEPLGALDLKLRKEMQIELKNMQEKLGITFIYVTHDQEEALTMSDKIAIMNEGEIQQIGSPVDIYNEPVNSFVASFIGDSNIVDGIMLKDELVRIADRDFICVDKGFEKGEEVEVVIRPEDLEIRDLDQAMIVGKVSSVTFKGVHYEMLVKDKEIEWKVHSTIMKEKGEPIGLSVLADNIHVMKKEVV